MALLCSNEKCPNTTKHPKESKCPECGGEVREYKYRRLFSHLTAKGQNKKATSEEKARDALPKLDHIREVPPHEMTDQELEEAISKDLQTDLPHHRLTELMDLIESGGEDSEDSLVLAAVFNQTKILIKQNELALRILKRAFGTSTNDSSPRAEAEAVTR